jgi:GAF domain-containing protein
MTDGLVDELRAVFGLTAAASTIGAPATHTHLLQMIVRTAAFVINARGGSLLLIDQDTQELVFEVATSEDVSELKHVRVPMGEGIAGLVAMTGQPIAVTDAQNDPRHAREIAEQTGYLPRSLLAVPLQYEDRVIGVIELMDKHGADAFDANDIHALGLFAGQAAVAIEQSQAQQNLAALLRELLGSLSGPLTSEALQQRVTQFAQQLEAEAPFRRSVELAQQVHEIAQYGQAESDACLAILRGFAAYAQLRRRYEDPAAFR